MPAPRAVLSDIHDFNLDPTQKFGRTSSSGRLAHDGNGVTSTTMQGKPPVATGVHFRFYGRAAPHVEPRPGLVKLAEPVHKAETAPIIAEEPALEAVIVAEELAAEERPTAEGLPDTDQAMPSAKKARAKKAQPAEPTQA